MKINHPSTINKSNSGRHKNTCVTSGGDDDDISDNNKGTSDRCESTQLRLVMFVHSMTFVIVVDLHCLDSLGRMYDYLCRIC